MTEMGGQMDTLTKHHHLLVETTRELCELETVKGKSITVDNLCLDVIQHIMTCVVDIFSLFYKFNEGMAIGETIV